MEINNFVIGKKIAYYRKKSDLTQKQLGAKLGKSKDYISSLERGVVHPSLDLLSDMSELFNESLDELLSDNISAHPLIAVQNYDDELTNEFAALMSVISTKRKEKILETIESYIRIKELSSN